MTAIDTRFSTRRPSRPRLVTRSTGLRIATVGIAAAAVIAIGGSVSSSSDSAGCQTWHPQTIVAGRHQHTLHPPQAIAAVQHSWHPEGATSGRHTWNPKGATDGRYQHTWNPTPSFATPVVHSWHPPADLIGACLPS